MMTEFFALIKVIGKGFTVFSQLSAKKAFGEISLFIFYNPIIVQFFQFTMVPFLGNIRRNLKKSA